MSTGDSTRSAPDHPVDLLVIGGTGLLGREVVTLATALGHRVVATHHRGQPFGAAEWIQIDISRPEPTAELIEQVRPLAIINAAYIAGGEHLHDVTAHAPAVMSSSAEKLGARFVHISTDLVFSGREGRPYTEDDPVDPVNDYGRAKVIAEDSVASHDSNHVIVRTSVLWGGHGDGGPQLRLVRDPEVRFFTAEYRSPLRVDRLAAACLELTNRSDVTGVLHLGGADDVNRLDLARLLAPVAGIDPELMVGGTPPPASHRPADCRLDSSRARSLLTSPLPGIRADASGR